ncbi:phosphoglycerate mutase [Xenorhabdus mauleonii]|uniref:phosphoglycerate mutase (2,3-diphosphoglycerate-dependent) n=1 Tax=Xenorhabdus mauleonii TaxID=351675 RepID=A0A1I3X5G2_9GAMM|nr:histidine phosphatase family protein [Xenorhabdus mauleonii]PHM46306.1 phosphoglycerate mutase [Xenorhabdus mauleonii]SFK14843.1 probable phosphoglycerate mutase [Xenorhabdus mauleonii]
MQIILIRHAETEWNRKGIIQGWLDSPVTERGHRETDALIAELFSSGIRIESVFSSPQDRTRAMASAIARNFGCTLALQDELKEQHFGQFEGQFLENVRRKYPDAAVSLFENNADYVPPQGESLAQAANRLISFIQKLPLICSYNTVCLVSHGHIIQAVIALLKERTFNEFPRFYHLNAGYSILEVNEMAKENIHVVKWGIASHLLKIN